MILETIPAIRGLTVDQKLRLVCELWSEVSHDSALSSDVGALLDSRIAEHQARPEDTRSTDEVTAGILQLKQRLAAAKS